MRKCADAELIFCMDMKKYLNAISKNFDFDKDKRVCFLTCVQIAVYSFRPIFPLHFLCGFEL